MSESEAVATAQRRPVNGRYRFGAGAIAQWQLPHKDTHHLTKTSSLHQSKQRLQLGRKIKL